MQSHARTGRSSALMVRSSGGFWPNAQSSSMSPLADLTGMCSRLSTSPWNHGAVCGGGPFDDGLAGGAAPGATPPGVSGPLLPCRCRVGQRCQERRC